GLVQVGVEAVEQVEEDLLALLPAGALLELGERLRRLVELAAGDEGHHAEVERAVEHDLCVGQALDLVLEALERLERALRVVLLGRDLRHGEGRASGLEAEASAGGVVGGLGGGALDAL